MDELRVDWIEGEIILPSGARMDPSLVYDKCGSILNEDRVKRLDEIIVKRSSHLIPVIEGLYDRGNISAVMRSAEAFGFFKFCVVETQDSFKNSARTSQGADKWLETRRFSSSSECINELKGQGYRVMATHLSKEAHSIYDYDFSQPTALVFGNEKEGVSSQMIQESDGQLILPMDGFTQSFNISVAAALCFQVARRQAQPIDDSEQGLLRALYWIKSLPFSEDNLEKFLLG